MGGAISISRALKSSIRYYRFTSQQTRAFHSNTLICEIWPQNIGLRSFHQSPPTEGIWLFHNLRKWIIFFKLINLLHHTKAVSAPSSVFCICLLDAIRSEMPILIFPIKAETQKHLQDQHSLTSQFLPSYIAPNSLTGVLLCLMIMAPVCLSPSLQLYAYSSFIAQF